MNAAKIFADKLGIEHVTPPLKTVFQAVHPGGNPEAQIDLQICEGATPDRVVGFADRVLRTKLFFGLITEAERDWLMAEVRKGFAAGAFD